jgi:CheY-like chemotaxis protein
MESSSVVAETKVPLVLIVEDDPDIRRLYAVMLKHAGYRVAETDAAVDGLERVKTLKPDVVLMDLALPGVDGYEATRRLKADPATAHVPIIVVTAHGYRAHLREASLAGANGFLAKPVKTSELLRSVKEVLARSESPSSS